VNLRESAEVDVDLELGTPAQSQDQQIISSLSPFSWYYCLENS